ncbi:MAG: hypothetical protein H7Y09_05850, partial [Chitinophagaceae bacterium]|nr:hypothetical protein [Anaerolineae bacterium]
MIFPTMTGSNLSGKKFHVPHDLEGDYNIINVAFDMYQQYSVDTWLPFLEKLPARYPNLRFYELPTVPQYGAFQRMLIDGWMRQGIPDPVVRARTITLYVNVSEFIEKLSLPGVSTIYTFLLDRDGKILSRIDGPFTDAMGKTL